MRLIAMVIVFAIPLVDILTTSALARWSGISVWWLLALGTLIGLWLLRQERRHFRARTLAALHSNAGQGLDGLASLFDSGRRVVAGFLFLFPGILSDGLGLLLWLLPINRPRFAFERSAAQADSVIAGQYRRVD